jgi:hypothetical protein
MLIVSILKVNVNLDDQEESALTCLGGDDQGKRYFPIARRQATILQTNLLWNPSS